MPLAESPLTRNSCISGEWLLQQCEDYSLCDDFDCGNTDLNEYFHVDARLHKAQLLTQTYCLLNIADISKPIALLDFCNDALKLEHYKKVVRVPHGKQHSFWPAVKLTRLGVQKEYQEKHIGTHLLNMVKVFFVRDNRTGCRFITVDSYKDPGIVEFYSKNDFMVLPHDISAKTVPMVFDLLPFQPPESFEFQIG